MSRFEARSRGLSEEEVQWQKRGDSWVGILTMCDLRKYLMETLDDFATGGSSERAEAQER